MNGDSFSFELNHEDPMGRARSGVLKTPRGAAATPVFMPVATQGTIKSLPTLDLARLFDWPLILANTYHLMLRPGERVLRAAGGLHKFMGWNKPLLTDSGGYQVYSLANNRTITEQGVAFRSHIDGSLKNLTPERSIELQRVLGADIVMAFDECTPYPASFEDAKASMSLTHRWLERSLLAFEASTNPNGTEQTLFPIVQGGMFLELRGDSVKAVAGAHPNAVGVALGGLSVGEGDAERSKVLDFTVPLLPKEKARYLMGVGTPKNLLDAINQGLDMFDCVIPTRHARHGLLYTTKGILPIKAEKWKDDFSSLDDGLPNPVSQSTTKAYLRHLFQAKECSAYTLATIQNLSFYEFFMADLRKSIQEGTFQERRAFWDPILSTKL